MDVEKTIEFLLGHQARMASENELFQAHQAEVRADHEEQFRQLRVSQLETVESIRALATTVDIIAATMDASKERRDREIAEIRELQRHGDERMNALIQIVDEIIRRPKQ